MMLPNMPALHLRKLGTATLEELATTSGMPINVVSANMAGLHDAGIVTKYGSRPTSLLRWEGEGHPWVAQQIEQATRAGVMV